MCGRFANHVRDMGRWAEILGDWPDDVDTSYNIAPGAAIAAYSAAEVDGKVGVANAIAKGRAMRWGLIPAWSKTPQNKYATFNARAETLSNKPTFRSAWQHSQRCLIPVQGYYEWTLEDGKKQASYIAAADGGPLIFAGLWDQWPGRELPLWSCTIITCPAISAIAHIHSRMPIMIEPEDADLWLHGEITDCAGLLVSPQGVEIKHHRVSLLVNNPRNQGENLTQPVTSE